MQDNICNNIQDSIHKIPMDYGKFHMTHIFSLQDRVNASDIVAY